MTKMRDWFDAFTLATGETPTHIVFGKDEYDDFTGWDIPPFHRVLPFADVPDSLLDHEFYAGFGGNDSPSFCAWSETWALFSDNYDGSESICWLPRNPMDHRPIRPGGG